MGLFDRLQAAATGAQSGTARPTQLSMNAPAFAVIDVETTGLSPARNRILELAIVRVDINGDAVDEWVTRMNPEGPVGATHIHGIRDQDVARSPYFRDLAPTIASGLSGLPIVAHNARFDVAFLRSEFETAGWDLPALASYCTLDASRHHLPHLDRRRLADCCSATGISLHNAHSALGDARATALLLRHYIGRNSDSTLAAAQHKALQRQWPQGPVRAAGQPVVRASPDAPRARSAQQERIAVKVARAAQAPPVEPVLGRRISGMSLKDLVDADSPAGTNAYLELLLTALEDAEISAEEAEALRDVRLAYELTDEQVHAAHEAFVVAVATRASNEGVVSSAEQREIAGLCESLGVPVAQMKAVMTQTIKARHARLSRYLGPLPDDWAHGEPLRVGDRVAFTGGDEFKRARLEKRAQALGVRVTSTVSKLTAMLVTDGEFAGNKLAKAIELSTRIVHPDVFEVMLRELQPPLEKS